jgi:integrase
VLDYRQAQRAARVWWRSELRREEGHDIRTGPFTVADAVGDCLKVLERRGGKSVYHARRAAEVHVLPALGALEVATLTAKRIEDWHHGLAEKPPLARSRPGGMPNHREADKSPDGVRRRRATAIARLRYLSEAECTRLVNACEAAFRNLVRGALLTGCRYLELAGLRTADFNADAGVVTIRESKAGKPGHVVLTDEGQRLFGTLTAGALADDPVFRRRDALSSAASVSAPLAFAVKLHHSATNCGGSSSGRINCV